MNMSGSSYLSEKDSKTAGSSYRHEEITITSMLVRRPQGSDKARRWPLLAFNDQTVVINEVIRDTCLRQLMRDRLSSRPSHVEIGNKRYEITFKQAHFLAPGLPGTLVPDTRLDNAQTVPKFLVRTLQNLRAPGDIIEQPLATPITTESTQITTNPAPTPPTPTESGRSLFWPVWFVGTTALSVGCGALVYHKWPQMEMWLSETVPPLLDYLSSWRSKAPSYLAIE